jgi:lysophospholipase L1-like esterase
MRRFLAVATAIGCLLMRSPADAAAPRARPEAGPEWVSAWATALQAIPEGEGLPTLYRAPEVAGRTVRQIVVPSLDGRLARVRISNAFAREPLVIAEARIAAAGHGAALRGQDGVRLRFGGRPALTLAPGAEMDSDPVAFDVAKGAGVAVSLYVGPAQRLVAWHRIASQVNYVSSPGNHAAEASGDAFGTRFTQYAWVTALSVAAPAARTIAAVGDSITDGMRSSIDRNQRWPDALARRLVGTGGRQSAVINLGISGNRLLSDSPCYGQALVKRLDHDLLDKPGVGAAVVMIGINDIDFPAMPPRRGLDCDVPHTAVTPADLIQGYRQVIAAAHRAGIRLYLATLTPASLPPPRERIRESVNRWIRSGEASDGIIDFDAALRDPAAPTRLRPAYDSGDHIHPSDAGYAAMADAVPLDLLGTR